MRPNLSPEVMARYADRPLPRYTSYPTAPHFTPGMTATDYADWLGALPVDEPLSLYIHVPFCRAMCWYCGCHTTITTRDEPIARYGAALETEIGWVADAVPPALPVRHLHFGGGTPSLMQPRDFLALMTRLHQTFRFAATTEVAIELDPRTLDADRIAALAEAGVNRVSLGVQSFDPVVQQAIHRVQDFAETATATTALRAAGIARINFDLIYGLPHQTVASCRETVAQALTLAPDRFAVFGYAHVPGFKPHQGKLDPATLPDGAERHAQSEAIAEALTAAGYIRIGLDHYARPEDDLARAHAEGKLHRNFQGYTTDACTTLLGFGASAIGRLPQGYVQNAVVIGDYERRIAAEGTAVVKSCAFQGEDRLRAAVIERIMCDYRVDFARFDARHLLTDTLTPLLADGLAELHGTVLTVPPAARPLVRAVAAAFDQYLDRAPARHSRTV